ncbi:MAG: protein kinase [Pirellulales bacterium]|nr:protein kinase [Pirellulales bacterium]
MVRNVALQRNPVEVLAEEFATRWRDGESPTVQEYTQRYPHLADEISELFPSLMMMEQLGQKEDSERTRARAYGAVSLSRLERLGDFRIVREIGRGGMGVVFEAEQESLGRHVAVKVFVGSGPSSSRQLERFQREAQAIANLHHTNIVPVFGVGEHDGLHYYVMQLIDGVGLDLVLQVLRSQVDGGQERPNSEPTSTQDDEQAAADTVDLTDTHAIHRAARLMRAGCIASGSRSTIHKHSALDEQDTTQIASREEACEPSPSETMLPHDTSVALGDRYWRSVARIGCELAGAVQYAHSQKVLHRDIKPSNVMLDRNGVVWVTDFGLAKFTESDELTDTGDIVGTLRYMAPEQFNGQSSESCDIYSIGITLFELLALRPAFIDSTHGALVRSIIDVGPPRLSSIDSEIPRDLETIVMKATAREPHKRYASAGELADDLRRFVELRPIRARRTSSIERLWRWGCRNPALACSTTAAVVLLMATAVVALIGNYKVNQALAVARKERRLAEDARDHIQVERNRAIEQHDRAEANFALAVSARERIIGRVSARGMPQSLEIGLEGEIYSGQGSALTVADAELLQELLRFFDQFAHQNSADLKPQTADAYRRIGEIRFRLGQFQDAIGALRESLNIYSSLDQETDAVSNATERARILCQIGNAYVRNGQPHEAVAVYSRAIDLLTTLSPDLPDTDASRLVLANAYTLLGSRPSRSIVTNPDVVFRAIREHRLPFAGFHWGPGPFGGHRQMASHRGIGGPWHEAHRQKGLQKNEYLYRALAILTPLVAAEPENVKCRLALSSCYRAIHSSESFRGSTESADEQLSKAIEILDQLVEDYPKRPEYRFDLADTLLASGPFMGHDVISDAYQERVMRGAAIAKSLAEQFAYVPEYQALYAGSQMRLATIYHQLDELEESDRHYQVAVERFEVLAKQYPENFVYQVVLAEARLGAGETSRARELLDDSRSYLMKAVTEFDAFRETQAANGFSEFLATALYLSLSRTLKELGDDGLADEYVEKASQLKPGPWKHRPAPPYP